jgi:hypothetical protein
VDCHDVEDDYRQGQQSRLNGVVVVVTHCSLHCVRCVANVVRRSSGVTIVVLPEQPSSIILQVDVRLQSFADKAAGALGASGCMYVGTVNGLTWHGIARNYAKSALSAVVLLDGPLGG